ncbi:MAG: ATP-binding cassette domain-containing protein [Geobacteraceae bacterium]|nr:ATP-binding cassette domain-containing protein [Geobacteraceae bacterium]
MIRITGLSKAFLTPSGRVTALQEINLTIDKGDIFGIIGFSGAGKSTLLRCLNRLEEPDSGTIRIEGNEITRLDKVQLREARKKIGMIFQQFNLFESRTVFGNVAFPLEIAGYPKERIRERVEEILELVELTDKIASYPAQLSGGQKQRVGIARALANKPDVLLSDEATSSLDPKTTWAILNLLQDINSKLGLTIVLITHEMDVLRRICRNAAVLDAGEIVETGPVARLIANPQQKTTRLFLASDGLPAAARAGHDPHGGEESRDAG